MSNMIHPSPADFVPRDLLQEAGNRLEGKIGPLRDPSGDTERDKLQKACQEFEAVFIAYMLKVMRETIEESGFSEGGLGKSIYTELFDQEVAQSMARSSVLGISDLLYRNLADSQVEEDSTRKSQSSPGLISGPVLQDRSR